MNLWSLLHRLFGWDYIYWVNSADRGVARIHKDKDGAAFYWRYKITRLADRVTCADQVIWLTCEPSKYLGKQP